MEIALTQGRTAVIDDEDWELVRGYSWYAALCSGKFYAQAKEPGTNALLYIHRLLTGAGPDDHVDHRDGDSLNFRRSNLRVCTQTQNNRNVGKKAGLSTRFKGVHWHKGNGR